ncbi:hypothetical protein A2U01_0067554, partial [Trifolium medium]|nr:hypothetical protein [Trifolium medium]
MNRSSQACEPDKDKGNIVAGVSRTTMKETLSQARKPDKDERNIVAG